MTLKLINLVALLFSVAWLTHTPGWEQSITVLLLFSSLLAKEIIDRRHALTSSTIPAEVTYVSGDLGRTDLNADALELFLRGRKARDQNRIKSARKYFDRAAKLQHEYWEALFERAHCDRRLRNFDHAIETLEYIVRYCPIEREVNRSHTELGVVYHDLTDYEEAYKAFEVAYDTCTNREENPVPVANLFSHAFITGRNEIGEKLREELVEHPAYEKVRSAIEAELSAAGIKLELPHLKS